MSRAIVITDELLDYLAEKYQSRPVHLAMSFEQYVENCVCGIEDRLYEIEVYSK